MYQPVSGSTIRQHNSPILQCDSTAHSCHYLTRSILVHFQCRLSICIMCILEEAFDAPRTSLSVICILAMMSVQTIGALAPLTIDTFYLSTLVTQGKFLGRAELRGNVMLITASIALVAIIAKME